jgi:hypothetical protein
MKIEELKTACEQVIASGRADIQLVVPKNSPPRNQVRAFGRWGPLSTEIALVRPSARGKGYDVVAWFPAAKVLAFLEEHSQHDGDGGSHRGPADSPDDSGSPR